MEQAGNRGLRHTFRRIRPGSGHSVLRPVGETREVLLHTGKSNQDGWPKDLRLFFPPS
jgi:hypothetical protein